MGDNVTVYISVLQDSLEEKAGILQKLLELTKGQGEILCGEKVDVDQFEVLMDQKSVCLSRLQKLDRGFQNLFEKIGDTIKRNPERYKPQVQAMQSHIRQITECGVEIEALEKKNKTRLASFLAKERSKANSFQKKSITAMSYHQNMANQHQEWQSHFFDKKR